MDSPTQSDQQFLDDFESWSLHTRVPQIRYIAFLTALLYLIYTVLEFRLHLAQSGLRILCHGVIIPADLLVIGLLSFSPARYVIMRWLLIIAPVIAAWVTVFLNMATPTFSYFAPELYLIIIWTFTISGLTLRDSTFSACLTVAMSLVMTDLTHWHGSFIGLHLLWMLAAFLFGFVGASSLEKVHRDVYLKHIELLRTAQSDSLTTLWNREKLTELLAGEISAEALSQQAFSVIILDIDHFKQVNDQFGHLVGDKVLISFAALLRQHVRQQDYVSRIGGEEFCILLPGTDLPGAYQLAQSLLQRINQTLFEVVGHKTASFGVAQYRSGESMDSLLQRADKALYRAKEAGRNSVQAEPAL